MARPARYPAAPGARGEPTGSAYVLGERGARRRGAPALPPGARGAGPRVACLSSSRSPTRAGEARNETAVHPALERQVWRTG